MLSFFFLILSGNLLGWYYSAPPLKLSYRGFSEIATVLTGFIVPGVGYVVLMGNIDLYFHNAFDQCVKVWPGNGIVDIYYAKTDMPHYFRYRFNDEMYVWADKTLNIP